MPDPLDSFRIEVPRFVPQIPDFTAIHESMRKGKERDLGYAYVMFEHLMVQVRDFEATLKPTEEVAAYLSSFGSQILVQIERIGFMDPYLVVFDGWNISDGKKVRLVQHTSQLSVLFTSMSLKPEETRPARRIGFFQDTDEKPG